MEDFVSKIIGELGANESSVRKATGGMLQLLQQKAPADDFQVMLNKVPGAQAMLAEAPGEASTSGGGLGGVGGLMGAASKLMGGGDSDGLGALSPLLASGLSLDDVPRFASSFVAYLQGKAGSELMGKLLQGVPDLKKFL